MVELDDTTMPMIMGTEGMHLKMLRQGWDCYQALVLESSSFSPTLRILTAETA